MTSLIDNIISLENEADEIIEKAHAASKDAMKSVDEEIANYRSRLSTELEANLISFEKKVEENFEKSIADASKVHEERLRALKELPEGFRTRQAERILDRFNNW